jgi:dTDP-4-amino-4,6-dideoxygalactose transaminase
VKFKYPFIKPSFPEATYLIKSYEKIVENNWYTNFGPFEKQLCKDINSFIGINIKSTTVASATLGLDVAIKVILKGSKKDKNQVIMPSFTFVAGAEVLISNGYTPVLVDINKDWQPDIVQAEENINKNTVGILLCNTFGVGNPQIREWEALSNKYNIPLIVDSAAGFGSLYEDGLAVGSAGNCEIFSFHATKPFAIGEGGAITSNDPKLINEFRKTQNFGFNDKKQVELIGTNAKLQELNCAIGISKMKTFSKNILKRQEKLSYYKKLLAPIGFIFQPNDDKSTVPFCSAVAQKKIDTQNLINKLQANGIEAKKYYTPIHKFTAINKYSINSNKLSMTENIYSGIINLPIYDNMHHKDIKYISDTITKYIQ